MILQASTSKVETWESMHIEKTLKRSYPYFSETEARADDSGLVKERSTKWAHWIVNEAAKIQIYDKSSIFLFAVAATSWPSM